VKGQIGVYGRSIGGIAACHLVSKFPAIIKLLIADRTLGDLEKRIKNYYYGCRKLTLRVVRLVGCYWRVNNGDGLADND
jgi:hypothetical protein